MDTHQEEIVARLRASMLPSVARDTGVDPDLLQAVVDGDDGASLADEQLRRVAHDLDVDVDWLLAGDSIGARIQAGLVPGLARAAGLEPGHLMRIFSGERRLSAGELALLGSTMGANIHWLLTGEEDPHRMRIICAMPRSVQ